MREDVITSLAILKVNWDRGHDYIDNFVPFVAECLRTAPQAEVSLNELQDTITEIFGLRIPRGALKTILKRAVRHGYVKREEGIYRRNEKALATMDFAKVRANVLRQHAALIDKLIEFCKTRYQVEWSRKEAEAALLIYFKDRSTPILAATVEGEPIFRPAQSARRAEFLVSAFIANLCEGDPEGFDFLETVVKGSMLANVLYFPDLGGVRQRFERVEVYFDTSFLLRALGLTHPSMQISCRELMDLLYGLNGKLRCFEHTVEEMRRVLRFSIHALQDRRLLREAHSEALEYFVETNYRASDVELVDARLEQLLSALRVRVKRKPSYEDWLGVDEVKLEAILQDEVRYAREETLRYDLESLTAIHRLRRGQFPPRFESCDAIFVTPNPALARASTRFFKEEYGYAPVPHCMSDHIFTTLVWLKKPLMAPELPRKRIIADCYAALNPPDTVWRLYLREIDRLQEQGDISEEDYYLLRFSTEAKVLLSEATLGDPNAFTEGTAKEILEKARATIRAEAEAAFMAERKKRLGAEQRVIDAEAREQAQRQAQLARLRIISVRGGFWIGRIVLVITILLLALAIYLTFPSPFPGLPGGWQKILVPLALMALGILTIVDLVFGITMKSYIKELEVRISHVIEQTLVRIIIP